MASSREDLRATIASAMFNHSVNPSAAAYFMRQFGAEIKPVTKEDVEKKFGPEAAQAWQDARDAKARYFAAIRAQGGDVMPEQPKPETGTLAELNVKPGDVVAFSEEPNADILVTQRMITTGFHGLRHDCPMWRIVSRAYQPKPKIGTLAELNVKPGDVVEDIDDGEIGTINERMVWIGQYKNFQRVATSKRSCWRIVSRASQPDAAQAQADTPKLLRDTTPEVCEWCGYRVKNPCRNQIHRLNCDYA